MQAPEQADNLAAAALENLVNQFARPLDFLRELVQNSIDAGSPRVEVRIERQADPSDPRSVVLTIHVEDWGGGMDERIIDSQLTRLFASSKEGDLTKIGKFGIGFMIRPLSSRSPSHEALGPARAEPQDQRAQHLRPKIRGRKPEPA